jgi:hypothetical protein
MTRFFDVKKKTFATSTNLFRATAGSDCALREVWEDAAHKVKSARRGSY